MEAEIRRAIDDRDASSGAQRSYARGASSNLGAVGVSDAALELERRAAAPDVEGSKSNSRSSRKKSNDCFRSWNPSREVTALMNQRSAKRDMMNDGKAKKRVLVAEDDPVSCHVLKSFLLKWDYDVEVVTDGMAALRILESEDAPRLAVLDWMMPGMEGVQICQRIRERKNRPYMYVLLLTARNEKRDLLRGLELGADDYLTKPFDSEELRARLLVGERILNLQDDLIAAREELRFRATHDVLTDL